MLPHPKISRLIPCKISLSSSYNHQDFLRRAPKSPYHLHLTSILEQDENRSLPNIKQQKHLIKIFRSLKGLKKIYQNDLALHRIGLLPSKLKYLMKKIQRIKILNIQDKLDDVQKSPARFDLWLKNARSLFSLNYHFITQYFISQKSIITFEKQIQKSLQLLPRHRKLATLKLRLVKSSSKVLESLLQFQKYPSSLKHFAIYQQRADDAHFENHKLLVSAFSRLKSIECLTLSGQNLVKIVGILLEKVPNILNIKKLNVQVFDFKSYKNDKFDLALCRFLQNLQHLKISSIDQESDLSKLTNPPKLKSLDITGNAESPVLLLISQFILLLAKSLKSLKMHIRHSYVTNSEETIQILFSSVSQLEILTSFKLKVQNMAPPFASGKVSLSKKILENLKGLFLKPVKLESFEWEVPRISGDGIFLDFVRLLKGSQSTLRKLKIVDYMIGVMKFQESELFSFIRSLESLEVFYLDGLHILGESFWVDLVDCFQRAKFLRSFGLEIVLSKSMENWFLNLFKKIAQKKGLEVLKIISPLKFEDEFRERRICLKEILRVNPELREVSPQVRAILDVTGFE